jgi:hypothetical protein
MGSVEAARVRGSTHPQERTDFWAISLQHGESAFAHPHETSILSLPSRLPSLVGLTPRVTRFFPECFDSYIAASAASTSARGAEDAEENSATPKEAVMPTKPPHRKALLRYDGGSVPRDSSRPHPWSRARGCRTPLLHSSAARPAGSGRNSRNLELLFAVARGTAVGAALECVQAVWLVGAAAGLELALTGLDALLLLQSTGVWFTWWRWRIMHRRAFVRPEPENRDTCN